MALQLMVLIIAKITPIQISILQNTEPGAAAQCRWWVSRRGARCARSLCTWVGSEFVLAPLGARTGRAPPVLSLSNPPNANVRKQGESIGRKTPGYPPFHDRKRSLERAQSGAFSGCRSPCPSKTFFSQYSDGIAHRTKNNCRPNWPNKAFSMTPYML